MKYADGQDVRLWDRLEAWPGCRAIVVLSLDTNEFSPAFPRKNWAYLERGVMLDTEQAGLVHVTEPDQELVLFSRGGPPTEDEIASLRKAQDKHKATGMTDGSG